MYVQAMSGGLAPIKLGQVRGAKKYLSLGNMFAGGVFLGGGLLHLLPESNEVCIDSIFLMYIYYT